MKPGDSIQIKAKVLRVVGNRLDAQTPNGELIQTDVSNVVELNPVINIEIVDQTIGNEKMIGKPVEDKAVKSAPENKSRNK